jgi:heterodisulfide reductase subunit A-like polyferredoxin
VILLRSYMRRSSSASVVLLALVRQGAGLQALKSGVHAPRLSMSARAPRVAVVGGGISGLSCGKALTEQGVDVVVYDTGKPNISATTSKFLSTY